MFILKFRFKQHFFILQKIDLNTYLHSLLCLVGLSDPLTEFIKTIRIRPELKFQRLQLRLLVNKVMVCKFSVQYNLNISRDFPGKAANMEAEEN